MRSKKREGTYDIMEGRGRGKGTYVVTWREGGRVHIFNGRIYML